MRDERRLPQPRQHEYKTNPQQVQETIKIRVISNCRPIQIKTPKITTRRLSDQSKLAKTITRRLGDQSACVFEGGECKSPRKNQTKSARKPGTKAASEPRKRVASWGRHESRRRLRPDNCTTRKDGAANQRRRQPQSSSHNPFNANFGFDGVLVSVPVTLQSIWSPVTLLCECDYDGEPQRMNALHTPSSGHILAKVLETRPWLPPFLV
jgi:hypothetical protein